MAKIKRFLYSHRVFFGLFAFLAAYEACVANSFSKWQVGEHFLSTYAVDFSLGFCSRFLPGAVYRLLFGDVNERLLSVLLTVLLLLIFFVLCILLERLLLKTPRNDRPLCIFAVLLFITGPASFSLFTQWLGVIDVYWICLCLLFVFALSDRRLYFLIPAVFILTVLVHYGALISYVPMMAVMMLYKLLRCDEKGERRYLGTVLVLSAVCAAGLTVYFILFERRNLTYTMEQFNEILLGRGAKYTYYYDYNVYRNISSEGNMSVEDYIYGSANPAVILFRSVWMQIRMTVALRLTAGLTVEYVLGMLVLCPVCAVLISVFIARARDTGIKGFLRRAVYLLPPVLFIGCFTASTLFSSDVFRWLTHSFLPLATVFLYMAYYEKDRFWSILRKRLSGVPAAALAAFWFLYAACAPLP